MGTDLERTGAQFEATPWTLLDALRRDSGSREAALDELCRRYWPAVYGYLRHDGKGREEASEVTQSFFVEVVLSRSLFERAAPSEGRLRSLMLTALKNYVKDQHRRAVARHEPGRIVLNDLDHVDGLIASASRDTPESAFDRAWASSVVDEAIRRARAHYTTSGKEGHWRLFESRVERPAATGATPPPLAEIFADHGFASPADAAAAVQTVKRRVQSLMQEAISETVTHAAEAADEAARIRAALTCAP